MDRVLKRPSIVAELFKAQARRIRSFLRFRLRSDEDAQDAAQDVFLRLWQQERNGNLEADARSYLLSAAYNAAVDVERHRAYARTADHLCVEELEIADGVAQPDDAAQWRRALRDLVDVLNELPDLTQQVFALSHIDGLTHVAIAERLDMSVRNVERHMARAIAHCEKRLTEYLE